MPSMIRLTYASTTTATPARLREELTDILNEARQFNSNHDIHGVLLYGNNYFYQCIEGNKTQVDQLYQKLLKDPRHTNIAQLSYKQITTRSFDAWEMKYVLLDNEIKKFFNDHGIIGFNPYKLDKDLKASFLGLLLNHHENNADQQEHVTSGFFAMQGRSDNLKYIMTVVLIGMLVLSLLYWSMLYMPKIGF